MIICGATDVSGNLSNRCHPLKEPDRLPLLSAINQAKAVYYSAHVRLEATIALCKERQATPERAEQAFDALMTELKARCISMDDAIGRKAVAAFAKYGKGQGYPAQLNFGDCLSFACAQAYRLPLLYVGNDFAQTELA